MSNQSITRLQDDLDGLTDVTERLLPVGDVLLKHHEKLGGLCAYACENKE